MKYYILIAEDDKTARETLVEEFTELGYEVLSASNGLEALNIIDTTQLDVILTDLKMPGCDGIKILQKAAQYCPVILMTAFADVETAVDSMKLGAFDFVEKPLHLPRLFALVERALQYRSTLSFNNKSQSDTFLDIGIIGNSLEMQKVFQQIRQVAPTDATVCITGESGTGKELVANAIHQFSRRNNKPFIKINCAAIPETLLESELFGHEKGAFTGALNQHKGKFEQADGGTILLDEISEMSPVLQAKLLRVLQEREFERIGGAATIKIDTRIIVSTNANLLKRISEGSFREDLYYRISVFSIELPKLSERTGDIKLLTEYFINNFSEKMNRKINGITAKAQNCLNMYSWPGNVRQLQNVIERACILTTENCAIDLTALSDEITEQCQFKTSEQDTNNEDSENIDTTMTIDELEKKAITDALKTYSGNKTHVAKALNIGLKTLYRKIMKYGIKES